MSVGATSIAAGFSTLLAIGGESLTLRNIPVTGMVARIRGEKDAIRFDRNKINYGTRGASVIELAVLDFGPTSGFAGQLPKAGEAFTDGDTFKHIVSDVVRLGMSVLCYCKVT